MKLDLMYIILNYLKKKYLKKAIYSSDKQIVFHINIEGGKR